MILPLSTQGSLHQSRGSHRPKWLANL